ncbi:DgyrCDS7764 [Dimorphilus gyrociliatus]|uniref:DgyrCDS7764 n=1 Tax=Dimorphilus gyrociliatus TaxID=2664684 RepID=A0A7I8VS26_9ANNE|nr:DgyrCDS7764 [Dimorphilus gyrociliatus]
MGGCAKCMLCFLKCIAVILLIPVFLVLAVAAVVVWIVTAPLKCCCPCCAPCLTLITEFLIFIAKLPWKMLQWIIGKEEKSEDTTGLDEKKKKDYGTKEETDVEASEP